jgi:succinylarginine dihydrolase
LALLNQQAELDRLQTAFQNACGSSLKIVEFSNAELSLEDAVGSYFFNSQLLTLPNGRMSLICPLEAKENRSALRATERLVAEVDRVESVEFLDLRQSMNNGGGPACLRLRVVMNEREQAAMHQGVRFSDELYGKLVESVETHYRDELSPADLRDPQLIGESRAAIESLVQILDLPLDIVNISPGTNP